MTLYEFIKKYENGDYAELLNKFKTKFPALFEFTHQISVIPWQPDFAIADKNPEIINQIEFYNFLLKNNIITEQVYKKQISKISNQYSSRTEAISFIHTKQVSFRSNYPPLHIIIHELGHIYFQTTDLYWNAIYSGGETLLHYTLQNKINLNESEIANYINFLKLIDTAPQSAYNTLSQIILKTTQKYNIPIKPPIITNLCLHLGYLPPNESDPDFLHSIIANLLQEINYTNNKLAKEIIKEICKRENT